MKARFKVLLEAVLTTVVMTLVASLTVTVWQASHPTLLPGVSEVAFSDYPFAAKLAYRAPDSGLDCSGSLIAPSWIITAAHCVEDDDTGMLKDPKYFLIQLGSGELVHPVFIYVDPTYERLEQTRSLPQDVALMRLVSPAKTAPLRLQTKQLAAGTRLRIVGQGCLDPTFDSCRIRPVGLKTIDTYVAGQELCRDWRGLCTRQHGLHLGSAVRSGDSGGAVMLQTARGQQLVAVVSGENPLYDGLAVPDMSWVHRVAPEL